MGCRDYVVNNDPGSWVCQKSFQGDGKFVPENVDARLCTHLIYAYANLDSETFEIVPSTPKVDIESGEMTSIAPALKLTNLTIKIKRNGLIVCFRLQKIMLNVIGKLTEVKQRSLKTDL